MKKNNIEKALNNLLKAAQTAKSASHISNELNDKIKFQNISKKLSTARKELLTLVFDYEDAVTLTNLKGIVK